jgi:DNA-binding NtrC family response regulator
VKLGKILIVDDEKDIRNLMEEIFTEEGYQISTAANGQQAIKAWYEQAPDVIFLDVWMPDIDGITLLKSMLDKQELSHSCVVMMSGHATIETAIEATKLGAYDFLEKPLSLAKILISAEKAMEHVALHQENKQLKQKLPEQFLPIGKSKLIAQLRETIERLAKYSMPILITGEKGTGKLRLAEAIYRLNEQQNQKILHLNAGEFSSRQQTLVGTEEKEGVKRHVTRGDISLLDGGTLIINSLEKLEKNGQDFLAQLIFEENYTRLGADAPTPIKIRVLAISNSSIAELQAQNFNKDLIKRLEIMQIQMPSLRQHTEDLPELIDYFIDFFLTHEGLKYRKFTTAAQNILRQYSWPGNFKELKNVIQRLLILGEGEVSDDEVKTLLESSRKDNQPSNIHVDTSINLKRSKEKFEASYLRQLLTETGGSVSETARLAGLERTNLYRKLKSLGINPKNPK